jgi:1-acylglycerone phosphate reductase
MAGTLPKDSLYAPIASKVEAMMRGETNPPGGHARELWAKRVVNDLLKSNPSPYVRRGFLAILIWLVSIWVPRWMVDFGFSQAAELPKLKKALKEQERRKSSQLE